MVRFKKYLGGLTSDGAQVSDSDSWIDIVLLLRKKEHWKEESGWEQRK